MLAVILFKLINSLIKHIWNQGSFIVKERLNTFDLLSLIRLYELLLVLQKHYLLFTKQAYGMIPSRKGSLTEQPV